jgi:hypothetical protein
MKIIGTNGLHINKTGTTTAGTRFISSWRGCTAAQSNNVDWYPLITFTVQNSSFPQTVFNATWDWTIYPDDGSSKRATWSGRSSSKGFLYFNSTSDKGYSEQDNYYQWLEGNFFGFGGAFLNTGSTGQFGIYMRSALNVQSGLSASAEFHCSRWDLITNIQYYTS